MLGREVRGWAKSEGDPGVVEVVVPCVGDEEPLGSGGGPPPRPSPIGVPDGRGLGGGPRKVPANVPRMPNAGGEGSGEEGRVVVVVGVVEPI